jgi:CDP-diacylglycerol--serine O-phosphatidyltransferase
VFAFKGNLIWSAYMVGIAAIFDFLDGFMARILKVHSEIGKQLDSLADMVTFGVLPGIVMFHLIGYACLIQKFNPANLSLSTAIDSFTKPNEFNFLPYFAFLIPVFSAIRLAKFNVDTRQTDSFIGLPTPANSIFICSIPLIIGSGLEFITSAVNNFKTALNAVNNPLSLFDSLQSLDLNKMLSAVPTEIPSLSVPWELGIMHPYLLIAITVIFSLLLVAPLPLFALKFKTFAFKGNEIRYLFLVLSAIVLILFQYQGIALSIVLYIFLSIVNNLINKKKRNEI